MKVVVLTDREWPQQHWKTVWFSDESRFLLHRADGRARVHRRRNELFCRQLHLASEHIWWRQCYDVGSVKDRTNLIQVQGTLTAHRYCDEILQPDVLPIMQGNGVKFQQDNARPHTARLTTAFFQTHTIAVLPWPSKSPGLNPIDHF